MLGLKPCEIGADADELRAAEQRLHGNKLDEADRLENHDLRVGLALSGGGVRSATFSLGILQALAKKKLLRRVGYLSTVSGGGYIGAFLGQLFLRDLEQIAPDECQRARADRENPSYKPIYAVEEILKNPRSRPLDFLSRNGRYLAPAGSGDMLRAVAVLLRNWVSVLVVMGTLALAMVGLLTGVRYLIWPIASTAESLPWSSPFYWPALWVFLFLAVPLGWSYWLAPEPRQVADSFWRWGVPRPVAGSFWRWTAPLLLAGLLLGWLRFGSGFDWARIVLPLAGAIPLLCVLYYLIATGVIALYRRSSRKRLGHTTVVADQRAFLSMALAVGLALVAVILALWLVDTAGVFVFRLVESDSLEVAASVYGGITVVALGARKGLAVLALLRPTMVRPRVSVNLVAHIAALLLILAILALISAVTHAVVWYSLPAAGSATRTAWLIPLSAVVLSALALSLVMGRVWPFVNRSTLHPLYEARLRRAYLGASNPHRINRDATEPQVTRVHPEDGIVFEGYHPESKGAPIHIINVTVNQTVGSRSAVMNKDRKGMNLAVGPAGISLGRSHHALWSTGLARRSLRDSIKAMWSPPRDATDVFRVFPVETVPESLDLGHWVAISGAAVSTGLGYRTSLGLSLLIGLFNVRLGYWWDSGVDPASRSRAVPPSSSMRVVSIFEGAFPVQSSLLKEWLAHFAGVGHRRWYLSDGGHFDNTGAYELIRRRLPFIILCDNEQDTDYEFAGLANLVRKARIDFGAEIDFLSDNEIITHVGDSNLSSLIGSLDSLRRGDRVREPLDRPQPGDTRVAIDEPRLHRNSIAHAALAKVTYSDEARDHAPRWLLYVKPTLIGDEPVDVLNYHNDHPQFPHEPTSDQFFDETQWESYRRLGEHIGMRLFSSYSGRWSPSKAMGGP